MVYVGLGSLGFFPPERVSKIFEAIGEAITQVRLELGMCEWVGGWRGGDTMPEHFLDGGKSFYGGWYFSICGFQCSGG